MTITKRQFKNWIVFDLARQIASLGDWLQVISAAHNGVHAGNFFFVKNFVDVTVANTDFLFSVPDTTKWPHAQWEFAGEGEFELYLYKNVVASDDGSEITPVNANGNSGTPAGVGVFTGPTLNSGALGDGSDGGVLIWAGKFGANRTAVIGRETNYEHIGAQNEKYWFRVIKVGAGTLWLDWDFNWYEHTNRTYKYRAK